MVTEDEVRDALKTLADNKAPGADNINIEMVKVLGEDSIKLLTVLLQEIWRTRSWPSDWKHSVYVPIPKKEMQENAQITEPLHSLVMSVKYY